MNIPGLAERQIELLGDEDRNFFQRYLNGVNAYITGHGDEHPLLLKLMKKTPRPWTLKDIVALQYFQVWSSSVNWRQELMNQQLLDALGPEKAAQLQPLNINPDDPSTELSSPTSPGLAIALQYDTPCSMTTAASPWAVTRGPAAAENRPTARPSCPTTRTSMPVICRASGTPWA